MKQQKRIELAIDLEKRAKRVYMDWLKADRGTASDLMARRAEVEYRRAQTDRLMAKPH